MSGPPQEPPGGYRFPPQQSYPPPPQQKSSALKWVLIGCGTFVIIGTIITILAVWWGYNRAKQAGLDLDLMEKKPALAAAKMVVAVNPDVEQISSDDERGILVIRDKKTGEKFTLDLENTKDGRVVFRNEEGEEVTFSATAEAGRPTVEVKTKEGTTATVGAGSEADVPSWVPVYPGATITNNFTAKSDEGEGGSFGFVTTDSVQQVINFYEDKLKEDDFTVTTNQQMQRGSGVQMLMALAAEQKATKRTLLVQIMTLEGKTTTTIIFGDK
jgi:hypothetical protein